MRKRVRVRVRNLPTNDKCIAEKKIRHIFPVSLACNIHSSFHFVYIQMALVPERISRVRVYNFLAHLLQESASFFFLFIAAVQIFYFIHVDT